jgi:hypothetical protein
VPSGKKKVYRYAFCPIDPRAIHHKSNASVLVLPETNWLKGIERVRSSQWITGTGVFAAESLMFADEAVLIFQEPKLSCENVGRSIRTCFS